MLMIPGMPEVAYLDEFAQAVVVRNHQDCRRCVARCRELVGALNGGHEDVHRCPTFAMAFELALSSQSTQPNVHGNVRGRWLAIELLQVLLRLADNAIADAKHTIPETHRLGTQVVDRVAAIACSRQKRIGLQLGTTGGLQNQRSNAHMCMACAPTAFRYRCTNSIQVQVVVRHGSTCSTCMINAQCAQSALQASQLQWAAVHPGLLHGCAGAACLRQPRTWNVKNWSST